MATKMIRVSESDAEWLTAFAGELQTARASRVSIAEAISTLIALRGKSEALYKAAHDIADRIAETEEEKEDDPGWLEVTIHKDEMEAFFAIVYNWNRDV